MLRTFPLADDVETVAALRPTPTTVDPTEAPTVTVLPLRTSSDDEAATVALARPSPTPSDPALDRRERSDRRERAAAPSDADRALEALGRGEDACSEPPPEADMLSPSGKRRIARDPATPRPGFAAPPASLEATSPYRAGAIIAGRYRLMRQLGRGGMGEVWSAHHLALNTVVAVKFLSTDAGGHAQRIALERFRFEAQVSAQLGQKTKHVVAVHDAGRDTAGPYLVMEHVRGRTLRAALNQNGPLAPEQVVTLLEQVAEALSVAHAFGIVHRDLKPSNLLLLDQPDKSLYVKVADFGIAKALRADLAVDRPEDTSDGWMLGSPAYMSPEQMNGGGVDSRTDLWALGVIAYEALTGRLPFPGRTVAELLVNIATGRFDPPTHVRPSLPSEVDAWCLRALARKKRQRFATVEEMARELRQAITGRPTRRLPRAARAAVAAVSLAAAMIALRPAPSEALSETPAPAPEAPQTVPAVVATPLPAPSPARVEAPPTAAPVEATPAVKAPRPDEGAASAHAGAAGKRRPTSVAGPLPAAKPTPPAAAPVSASEGADSKRKGGFVEVF